jgi:hypothetical protein
MAGEERISKLAENHDEHAYVGGIEDAAEVEFMESLGSIVLRVEASEVDKPTDAGNQDIEELEGKDSPEKVAVDAHDEIIAPVAGKEIPRLSLGATESPKAVHVGATNDYRSYDQDDANQRRQEEHP